jgi:uncharacterized membrane protein YhaH (DUF805 family)
MKELLLREFSTSGRLQRSGFWLRHLTVVPLGIWIAIASRRSPGASLDVPVVLVLMLLLVSTWGRRLHDRGRSAWWLALVVLPVLGAICLIVECGLRGTSGLAARFGPATTPRADYLVVRSSTEHIRTP